jgi:hypothetical protein
MDKTLIFVYKIYILQGGDVGGRIMRAFVRLSSEIVVVGKSATVFN